MTFREATLFDITQIQRVRNSVTENTLSDPGLVTDEDCIKYLTERGKGWVCETGDVIVGFSIVDLVGKNIWAIFVHPDFDKKGIGRQLQEMMLEWYFNQTTETVWLGTAPNTRAEVFYRKSGWAETGVRENGEIRFEMTYHDWYRFRGVSQMNLRPTKGN